MIKPSLRGLFCEHMNFQKQAVRVSDVSTPSNDSSHIYSRILKDTTPAANSCRWHDAQ